MKNNLEALNNYLFEAIERIQEADTFGEELDEEIKRVSVMSLEKYTDTAETFERMAFELGEERELLIKGILCMVDACDFCEFGEEKPECDETDFDCSFCGYMNCPCHNCCGYEKFVFGKERAKKYIEQQEKGSAFG